MCLIAGPCRTPTFSFFSYRTFCFPLTSIICHVFYVCIVNSTPEDAWELHWHNSAEHEEAYSLGMGHVSQNRAPSLVRKRIVHQQAIESICPCWSVLSPSVTSNSFATPWTIAWEASLSMGFPRQGYWYGLPFLSPGDLPIPGTEPTSPASPALEGGFFGAPSVYKVLG